MPADRSRLREIIRALSYREGDFVLASGKRSSFYVDLRRTSLSAEGSALIGEALLEVIEAAGWKPAAVGGLTLGADPLATATSLAYFRAGRNVGAFIVRKEAKGHGAGRLVEMAGDVADGSDVVVLDDTCTTGGSTLKAIEAMQAAGYNVLGAACIVDRTEGGEELLAAAGHKLVRVFALADLR
jgi:orotate phosphoribosyltransferase